MVANWRRLRDRGEFTSLAALEGVKTVFRANLAQRPASHDEHEFVRKLLAYLVDSASPLVTLDAVCHAFHLFGRQDMSMQELGHKHGISRQAFSIHVGNVCRHFGIAPTGSLRPEVERAKYKAVQDSRWAEIDQDAPR